jgi:hypothetical protein
MVMDLNKHIITNDSNSLFHTSGYAQVANGNRLGAINTQTFEERQKIERNRQLIAGYNRSTIGQSYNMVRAKPVINRGITRPSFQPRSSVPHFSEPRGRVYNPYS